MRLDNSGALTERPQLFSSVDVAGFLLTLANGNNNWRSQYPWLASRAHFAEALQSAQQEAIHDYVNYVASLEKLIW